MTKNTDDVSCPDATYQEMEVQWELLESLLGGTIAMRKKRERFLPREPMETPRAYDVRLERSFLHNEYDRAINRLTSKPFSKRVSIDPPLPDELSLIEKDADGCQRSFSEVLRDAYRSAAIYGLGHFFIDMEQEDPDDPTMERFVKKRARIEPTIVHIPATDLIGRRKGPDGKPTMIRFRRSEEVPDGKFGSRTADRIYLYTPNFWSSYEKVSDASAPGGERWAPVVEGREHGFGRIPIRTFYFSRTGYMAASPPLRALAELNLRHWQSNSDQTNILRIARFAILFGSGMKEEDEEKVSTVGPTNFIFVDNPEADLKYVEHTGAAITAGERDLEALERKMQAMGNQPFFTKSGDATATGRAIDESTAQTDVESWIQSLESVALEALQDAAEFRQVTLDPETSVDIFSDFGLSINAESDKGSLLEAYEKGIATGETTLRELKRRGVYDEKLDVATEAAAAKLEAPTNMLRIAANDPFSDRGDDDDDDDDGAS